MKQIWMAGVVLLVLSAQAHAVTKYVNDIMKITFRTGPGIAHKVLDEVPSGERVEVLRTENTWSHVRLPDSRTGWVLTRFLTADRPKTLQLEQAKKRASELTDQMTTLAAENETLKEENQSLKSTAEKTQATLVEVRQSYEDLKENCGDYLQIKKAYESSEQALESQGRRLSIVEKRLRERNIYLFLSGAGVLIFGFLIGRSGRSNRRRSPYI